MLFQDPLDGAFGLDIGDLSIKLVQLKSRRHFSRPPSFSIKEIRSVALSPGYIINGELQQPEMVRKKLLYILGKEGQGFTPIVSPWAVVDLPEPKTFIKLIDIDLPCNELTSEDVAYHIKKHLPFELEETSYDWQVVNNVCDNKETSKVLVGAAPRAIADSYTYLLESVGLLPLALEIEAVSVVRSMITADKDYTGEARAILDVGGVRSSLIIYDKGSLQFSTTLSFSGELLTTALAQGLSINHKAAEELKIRNGLNFDKKIPEYLKIVSERVDGLTDEIKKTLLFYKEHFDEPNPVTRIIMCGGGASLEKLDDTIARKLKIAAGPGNVWKNLYNDNDKKQANWGSEMASSVGLAMRAAYGVYQNGGFNKTL